MGKNELHFNKEVYSTNAVHNAIEAYKNIMKIDCFENHHEIICVVQNASSNAELNFKNYVLTMTISEKRLMSV